MTFSWWNASSCQACVNYRILPTTQDGILYYLYGSGQSSLILAQISFFEFQRNGLPRFFLLESLKILLLDNFLDSFLMGLDFNSDEPCSSDTVSPLIMDGILIGLPMHSRTISLVQLSSSMKHTPSS